MCSCELMFSKFWKAFCKNTNDRVFLLRLQAYILQFNIKEVLFGYFLWYLGFFTSLDSSFCSWKINTVQGIREPQKTDRTGLKHCYLTHISPVLHFIEIQVIGFTVQIKWLVSIWNATLSWNGLIHTYNRKKMPFYDFIKFEYIISIFVQKATPLSEVPVISPTLSPSLGFTKKDSTS